MSRRNWQDRIRDILDAINEIQKFTRGMDHPSFKEDEKAVRAVDQPDPRGGRGKYGAIPWSLMRAMRNRIVHAYFKVDEKLMWDTIRNDLPPLIPELGKLL